MLILDSKFTRSSLAVLMPVDRLLSLDSRGDNKIQPRIELLHI